MAVAGLSLAGTLFASTQYFAISQIDLTWRRDLNEMLSQLFVGYPTAQFYFQGKADAYGEMLALTAPPQPADRRAVQ